MACLIGFVAADPPPAPRDIINEENDIARAMITAAPVAMAQRAADKRQDDSQLIAYYSWNGTWSIDTCEGPDYFATSGTIGGCCPDQVADCNYATACGRDEVKYISGTANCNSGYICDTVTVLASQGVDPADAHSVIRCFSTKSFDEIDRTYYRETFSLPTPTPTPTPGSMTETETAASETTTSATGAAGRVLGGGGGGSRWGVVVLVVVVGVGVVGF
ncbi:hypothetical protein FQN53_008908 [Emmonsiellopsis sp. PD_33]|nr:hypothetical protein FQN53_008908 [Emmonsiellopsis sp. PD_33]